MNEGQGTKKPRGKSKTTSIIGTNSSSSLDVNQICRIIEVGKLAGLASLKLQGLELVYQSGSQSDVVPPELLHSLASPPARKSKVKNSEPLVDALHNEALKEFERTQKLIDSPQGFEDDMIDSLLTSQDGDADTNGET